MRSPAFMPRVTVAIIALPLSLWKPPSTFCWPVSHSPHQGTMTGSTSHTLEEVQSSASWDPAEQSDAGNSGTSGQYGRPALRSLDSPGGLSTLQPNSSSPQPRSSTDSVPRSSTSRWRDSPTVASDPRETLASVPSETASLVDGGFDGNVLRALCDLDVRAVIYVSKLSA